MGRRLWVQIPLGAGDFFPHLCSKYAVLHFVGTGAGNRANPGLVYIYIYIYIHSHDQDKVEVEVEVEV